MANTIDLNPVEPRYVKVAAHLRHQLKVGAIKPGERLPSFPEMKAQHGVSQATMERAHAILEKEGLIVRRRGLGTFVREPQPVAKGTIGISGIARNAQQLPYYIYLMQGFQQAAATAGRELLLLNENPAIPNAKVDGIVGVLDESTVQHLPPGVPAVSILVPARGFSSVIADDYSGSRQAVEHLLALGHRRIALLGASSLHPSRLQGYQDALRAAGVEPLAAWVHEIPPPQDSRVSYRERGHLGMTDWLRDDWRSLGCTALLTHNDYTAIGVMQALGEASLRIPNEVSVIGFDGTEVCDCFVPRLTSIEVPLEQIGITAMQTLLDQIESPAKKAETIVLPTRLQMRESTGTPAS